MSEAVFANIFQKDSRYSFRSVFAKLEPLIFLHRSHILCDLCHDVLNFSSNERLKARKRKINWMMNFIPVFEKSEAFIYWFHYDQEKLLLPFTKLSIDFLLDPSQFN